MPSEKRKAAGKLASAAAKTVKDYVEKFRTGLPSSTLNSTKYSFNVYLVPKIKEKHFPIANLGLYRPGMKAIKGPYAKAAKQAARSCPSSE